MIAAIVLIAVGGAILIAGELLGVFSTQSGDTVTEWVVWLRNTAPVWWLFWVPFLAGLGWLVYHLATS
jgi:hypothetical protein